MRIIRFASVGAVCYLANVLIFLSLAGLGYSIAALGSFVLSTCLAFALHKNFTFNMRGRISLSLIAAAVGFVWAALLLHLFIELSVTPMVAQMLAIALNMPLNFVLQRRFVFRHTHLQENNA